MSRLCAFLLHRLFTHWPQRLAIVVIVLFYISSSVFAAQPEIIFSVPLDGQIIRANNGFIQVHVQWLDTVNLNLSKNNSKQHSLILKVNGNVITRQRTGVFVDVPVRRGSNSISVEVEDHLGAVLASSTIEVMILKVSRLMRPK